MRQTRPRDSGWRNLLPALALLLAIALPARADFQDRGMQAGAARTDLAPGKGTGSDFLTLWYRNAVPDGCAFSVLDPLNEIFGCPGLSWIRDKGNGQPGWTGMQLHRTCGSNSTALGRPARRWETAGWAASPIRAAPTFRSIRRNRSTG